MSIHHITEIAGGESGSRPSQSLADLLARAGADVTIHWSAGGHGLSREDLDAGEKWMESLTAGR